MTPEDVLTCARCGESSQVRLTDADGNPITVAEYLAALEVLDGEVVCDNCVRESDQSV